MSFKDLLNRLYPPDVFPLEEESVFQRELTVEGAAFQRANDNAQALKDEMHPETATISIADWERKCGLTAGPDDPLQTRRQRVIQKENELGGLSIPYFISLAAGLGYEIEIEQTEPPMSGIAHSGDTCFVHEAYFIWIVTILNSDAKSVQARSGDARSGDRLLWWPTDAYFESMMNRLKRSEFF